MLIDKVTIWILVSLLGVNLENAKLFFLGGLIPSPEFALRLITQKMKPTMLRRRRKHMGR